MLPLNKGLDFYLKAHTVYSSQSMLFYDFFKEVLEDQPVRGVEWIEQERKKLLSDKREFERMDLGAGRPREKDSVRRIAQTALSTPAECRRLWRLASFLKPKKTLELGTSLGISSAYIASGHPSMHYMGVEGDPFLAHQTEQMLRKVDQGQIKVHASSIRDALNRAQEEDQHFDLVYMDGHHEYEATTTYFKMVVEMITSGSMVVVDDITWSNEMLKAWEEIRRHPLVTASLSYMGVGYLFFSENFLTPIHEDWVDIGFKPWTRFWSW